ncbi:MAG: type I restriction endonuclease subunit R [Acidobacteria bacterium]|nr:MAG: type I restriction endonuclease subunit R [Acidobacteriota bacterium]REK01693.1 MAG: type I restriction endonuclease subunit R [Acidobacteriota bacterium]REK14649.1 MAG: type I restriction endonuclease subunit R [Acidobacteriota bacterium]REK45364.1 MAG: type I restriction endonuclease subunit R [Acidobacteriota bacterium]
MSSEYSEDALIEQPAIELLKSLGWDHTNLYSETFGESGSEKRQSRKEVILKHRLRTSLKFLNPELPSEAIELAIEELTQDRSALIPVNANHDFYKLLKGGVKVTIKDESGISRHETVKVIDWNSPENNDFFLASQFWIEGSLYTRRTDLVGFVNGLPLLFIELKAAHKKLYNAFKDNLRDYKKSVPQLFVPNALVVLSNGSDTRVGSITAGWEHFFEWKRINSEGEQGVISLETALRGVCEPSRFLDIVENFTVFEEVKGGLAKKVAKNHQYLGVNQAFESVEKTKESNGRIGVFWHTQGSGKSLSMVFFTQKILRKRQGNWTFLVITDRDDLDSQIYQTFVNTGAVTEERAQATSGENLKQLLTEDHRYVFTLIQKFRTDKGSEYPMLSERGDIIVMTDEAHRSQYDVFALNMRNALPRASFIGFTGTPLIKGQEEKTREVFGDYVSVYNFRRSIEDRATVPLYYENRIPELQLTNDQFNSDMEAILEEAELDEAQEKKLEREFSNQYHLISREDRLETIAKDVVDHFIGRGYQGKAMYIAIDKATAVKMYDKVQRYWQEKIQSLKSESFSEQDADRRVRLDEIISQMESTDMAVVVSQSQNEIDDLREKGVEIKPHRERMVSEDLDEKFKDPNSNLRMVFVCAMWITGFDVPTCSTIYLDKPMRNHTLMQTIARANRVAEGKVAGVIVDYVGMFRDLQRALAIYASDDDGTAGDEPIKDKKALVEQLQSIIAELKRICSANGIDLDTITQASGFEKVGLLDDAVEKLIKDEDLKKHYMVEAQVVRRVFKAILPDRMANEIAPDAILISVLRQKITELNPTVDVSDVMERVEALLDRSVAAEAYRIEAETGEESERQGLVNLSEIDFEALAEKFKTSSRKHTEAEKLKNLLQARLTRMLDLNHSRMDYLEKFQKMIDEYNSGSKNLEEFFKELVEFAQALSEEEERAVKEGLTEEELALFDLLTKPEPELTEKEETAVKKVARDLLEKVKKEKLVLDWRKRQQTKAAVQLTIDEMLDLLPAVYTKRIYDEKCKKAFEHFYVQYPGARESAIEIEN